MLEIRYNINTKEVLGWCGDENQFGNLDREQPDEAIVILDIPIPVKVAQAYLFDETTQTLVDNPDYVELISPPLSTHLARLEDINPLAEKPARVVRVWGEEEYHYDCYVTENIKDQWQAGGIAVGDYVLVEFLEDNRTIVIAKVFKTW